MIWLIQVIKVYKKNQTGFQYALKVAEAASSRQVMRDGGAVDEDAGDNEQGDSAGELRR